jgi:hypothetical protein
MLGTRPHMIAEQRRVVIVVDVIGVIVYPNIRLVVLALGSERAAHNLNALNRRLHVRKSTSDNRYLMPTAASHLDEANPQIGVCGERIVEVEGYLHGLNSSLRVGVGGIIFHFWLFIETIRPSSTQKET